MRKKKLTLNNPRNVRAALAKLANWTLNGEIDTKTANAVTYICTTILQSIRTDEQQQQIDAIEEQLTALEVESNTNARRA